MQYESIVSTLEYGEIQVKLDELILKRNISKTKLAKLANTNYKNIKRLCDCELQKVDLDILARICFVLKCELSDIMTYNHAAKGVLK